MSTVTGTVKVVSKSIFGYGLMLEEEDGKWYNSKFEIRAGKGESVTFDDGGKNYVNKLKVNRGGEVATDAPVNSTKVSTKTHFLPVPLENSRAIIRQNALTNARELMCVVNDGVDSMDVSQTDVMVERIIQIARVFEEYTSGDSDVTKAEEVIKLMGVV